MIGLRNLILSFRVCDLPSWPETHYEDQAVLKLQRSACLCLSEIEEVRLFSPLFLSLNRCSINIC